MELEQTTRTVKWILKKARAHGESPFSLLFSLFWTPIWVVRCLCITLDRFTRLKGLRETRARRLTSLCLIRPDSSCSNRRQKICVRARKKVLCNVAVFFASVYYIRNHQVAECEWLKQGICAAPKAKMRKVPGDEITGAKQKKKIN